MKKYKALIDSVRETKSEIRELTDELNLIADESLRVANLAKSSQDIIEDIEKEFLSATKLNKVDVSFLFLAIALQCARQYLIPACQFQEKESHNGDKEKDAKKKEKEKTGNKPKDYKNTHKLYNPSLEEIAFNTVPYDISERVNNVDIDVKLGGVSHRFTTLGHDPILGWIFGTMNITTSTLTSINFNSYHVKYNTEKPCISSNANTSKVFSYSYKRYKKEPKALALSLIRQWYHIKSDEGSKAGLPIPFLAPFINALNKKIPALENYLGQDVTRKLAKIGIRSDNIKVVGNQAKISMLINLIIFELHSLLYNEVHDLSIELYNSKTRKILMYSNIFASSSNIIITAFRGFIVKDKKAIKNLDIGGLIVTIHRIVSDTKFIREIQKDFLKNEFYKKVAG